MHPLFWDPELSRIHLHPQIQICNEFPVLYNIKLKYMFLILFWTKCPISWSWSCVVSFERKIGKLGNLQKRFIVRNIVKHQIEVHVSNFVLPNHEAAQYLLKGKYRKLGSLYKTIFSTQHCETLIHCHFWNTCLLRICPNLNRFYTKNLAMSILKHI